MTNQVEDKVSEGTEQPDNGRREALKKMAKYSAYSAPALLALMKSSKAGAPISSHAL
jgi:hypothetical protein